MLFHETSGPKRFAHAPAYAADVVARALAPLEAAVVASGRCVASPAPAAAHAADDLHAAWLVCVPLREGNDCVGALTVFGTKRHPPLSIAVVAQLAAHATAAIENGRRYRAALEHVKARDEALATLSHDLKNPIGAILMNAALVLNQRPAVDRRAGGRAQVEAIVRCATRMRRLVTDLLDLAALDDGASPLRPAAHALRPILREVFDVASAAAQSGGVELVDALPEDLPRAYVDPTRIGQVLANLVDNAIRYTPRGGRVVASARVLGGDIEVAIADMGRGIPPAQLAFVFDRFWRAPAAAKTGSGLGLAICKTLVELSGGKIRARSTLGAGTTMTFTVPRISS